MHAILPFRYFPQVKVGARVVVPEKPFTGELTVPINAVDRVVDSAAGTFGVVVRLPNEKQDLPGGDSVHVHGVGKPRLTQHQSGGDGLAPRWGGRPSADRQANTASSGCTAAQTQLPTPSRG